MNVIFFLTSALFFIWIVRNTFFWVSFWQLKEYRFDRVFVHLKETWQGRNLLFSPLSLLKWVTIFGFVLVVLNDSLLFPYQFFVAIIFYFQALPVLKEFIFHSFKKPVLTLKAIFIILGTLFIIFLLFPVALFDKFLWLLILDRLVPLSITLFIFFLSFPTEIYRDLRVEQAIKKIRAHKKLLVIGVTGSYGKSSTKEFIGQILSQKFNVLRTPGTNNTPIGIANTVINNLQKDKEVFVVEMGAYKRGEITRMCQMVKPKIGVLTGISPQHLSLFGSLKNTIEAKYELIEALPKKEGLAVFNGNNPYCKKLFAKTKNKKLIYSFDKDSDIKVSDIKIKPENVSFKVKVDSKSEVLITRLLGEHNIENLLPAILIAHHLGMSLPEIKKAVSKIDYVPETMRPYKTQNGLVLIDDTFNASPDAVLAAIEYMKIFRGKKILVLQPMIELGKEAGKSHYEIGLATGKSLTHIFLTNQNFSQDFKRGVKDAKGDDLVEIAPTQKIVADIKKLAGRGDVVVFEGKEAAAALKRFLNV